MRAAALYASSKLDHGVATSPTLRTSRGPHPPNPISPRCPTTPSGPSGGSITLPADMTVTEAARRLQVSRVRMTTCASTRSFFVDLSYQPTFRGTNLIDRGQVQAVRNEYGTRDLWTGIVSWFVRGAGPSGIHGFTCRHERLKQKRFLYSHSECFETGHMTHNWVPFVNKELPDIPARDLSPSVRKSNVPWALYLIYSMAFCLAGFFLAKGVWVP